MGLIEGVAGALGGFLVSLVEQVPEAILFDVSPPENRLAIAGGSSLVDLGVAGASIFKGYTEWGRLPDEWKAFLASLGFFSLGNGVFWGWKAITNPTANLGLLASGLPPDIQKAITDVESQLKALGVPKPKPKPTAAPSTPPTAPQAERATRIYA